MNSKDDICLQEPLVEEVQEAEDSTCGETSDRLLDVKEMAAHLGIKTGTLKDWTKRESNPCPCFRGGSRILRFDKSEVMIWFREMTATWKASGGRPKGATNDKSE